MGNHRRLLILSVLAILVGAICVWLTSRNLKSQASTISTLTDEMTDETEPDGPQAQELTSTPQKPPQEESIDRAAFRFESLDDARVSRPDVFDELEVALQSARHHIETKNISRPGFFAGLIRNFTSKGPENRYVDERVGFEDTKYGQRAVRRRVEKFTVDEVQTGIARNSAARWAVLDHFLNSSHKTSEYEQKELISFLVTWATSTRYNELSEADLLQILKSVAQDKSRIHAVRVEAATNLPAHDRPNLKTEDDEQISTPDATPVKINI